MAISETRILINLSNKLKKILDKQAQKRHLTRSGLIRMALGEWLEQAQLKQKLEKAISKGKK